MSQRISGKTALAAALISIGFALSAAAQTSGSGSGAGTSATGSTSGAGGTAGSRSGPTGTTAAGAGSSTSSGSTSTPAGTKTGSNALSSKDRKFVETAAQDGMAEVQLGQLAAQKASSPEVKQFAQRMVDDHTKANDQLKQIASTRGITLPTDVDSRHKRDMDKLSKMSGAEFDRAYMDHMVADHKKDAKEFQSQAKNASDPDIKSFAATNAPILTQHLQLAQSTDQSVKQAAKGGGSNSASSGASSGGGTGSASSSMSGGSTGSTTGSMGSSSGSMGSTGSTGSKSAGSKGGS